MNAPAHIRTLAEQAADWDIRLRSAAFLNAVVAYFPVEAHRTPGGETVLTGRP